MAVTRPLTSGQRDWLRVRSYLQEHRHDLAVSAADDFPGIQLLAAAGWQPPAPVPLSQLGLEFGPPDPPRATSAGTMSGAVPADVAARLWPERPDGTRYPSYSDAMRELAAPSVFENRPTYRLTDAELTGGAPRLAFTRGHYFDGIDT